MQHWGTGENRDNAGSDRQLSESNTLGFFLFNQHIFPGDHSTRDRRVHVAANHNAIC